MLRLNDMQESQPGSIGLRLLAVLVLVVANAFFVAAEFALVSARRTRIEALIRQGDRKAKAVRAAQQDLYRQLSAAQLGITVASILLGFVAEDTVAFFFRQWLASLPTWLAFLGRAGVASVIALSLISFLHVVFGEQAPKAVAITHPEAVSRWVATPLLIFSWITRPATGLLNSSANWLIRLMGIKGASPELERIHSPEEIRMLVEQSEEGGSLQQEDARLLEEIVGPIYDEHDPQDGVGPTDGAPRIDGSMPISEFNNQFDAALDDTDYTTIGGYVFGQLGRLPRVGDRITIGPSTFEVVEMEGRRVKTVRLHNSKPEEAAAPKPA